MRRKVEKMLFEGQGRQLLWLSVIIIIVLLVLLFIDWAFVDLKWQAILATFMDPGNFATYKGNDFFRLIIALLGVFLFSALLISVFTNIFENISTSYKKGESVYSFSNHILIIGASHPLKNMLFAIRDNKDMQKRDILIMTTSNVEKLRNQMEIQLADPSFFDRITFFHRERNALKYLQEACAEKASIIFIIGENKESAHDALNIRCLNYLKDLCGDNGPVIPCYVMMEMHSTLKVFNYMNDNTSSRLTVEIVNESDYTVEQLLVNTSFLPALTKDDEKHRVRIVLVGNSRVSRSFASVAAQICHYPNFKGAATRTIISMIEYSKTDMNNFLVNYSNMFDVCHYRYVSQEKTEEYAPKKEYGDFMDIEWEFIEGKLFSPYVVSLLESWVSDRTEIIVFAICLENDATNAYIALHMPRKIYDSKVNIAVYQNDYSELIATAAATKMYGNIFIFGKAHVDDMLFMRRSSIGKRVNRIYDLEFGNPPAKDEDDAWNKLPYAHKYSSIASANSIAMKMRCFHIEPTIKSIQNLSEKELKILSEVEHRRWMSTQLIMGYRAAPIKERRDRTRFKELKDKKFIHLDIAPFDELPGEEEKDLLIIKNIPYIITGKTS